MSHVHESDHVKHIVCATSLNSQQHSGTREATKLGYGHAVKWQIGDSVLRSLPTFKASTQMGPLQDVTAAPTCAQQNLAPSQEPDCFRCLPETFLRQVRRIRNHDVKTVLGNSFG